MAKYNFKIGDKVRIRSWDDMAKEFGSLRTGIDCKMFFSLAMKHLCGRTATIKNIYPDSGVKLDFDNTSGDINWNYSTDMIEPFSNKEEEISIKRYGNKVVAKYGKKVGIAKCAPEDTFDFMTGAKIALLRLAGQGKSKSQITKELIDIIYNNFND